MGDSRKHLLNSIDIAFSLYRSRSDSAIPEEELQQLEADLKGEISGKRFFCHIYQPDALGGQALGAGRPLSHRIFKSIDTFLQWIGTQFLSHTDSC